MILIAQIVNAISQLVTLVVIINVILSYFVSPYHPVKQTLDRVVEPMLAPIRRYMPSTGMVDFSPMVLILLVQIVARLLVGLLISI